MTSGTSFKNQLRETAKNRIWQLAVVLLFLFITLPMSAAALITKRPDFTAESGISEEAAKLLFDVNIAEQFTFTVSSGLFLYAALALFLAVCGFGYLYRSRETDFYHALPVTRKRLFLLNYLTGALFFLVPYVLNLGLSVLIVLIRVGGALDLLKIGSLAVYHGAFFLLIYAVCVAAVMLTGTFLCGFLGGIILCVYGSAAAGIYAALCETFQLTRLWDNTRMSDLAFVASPFGMYIKCMFDRTGWDGFPVIPAVLLAALLVTLLSLLLYQARRLEHAGRAMAFPLTEPFLKLFLAVPAAVFGGLLFYEILESEGWGVFGTLFSGILSCALIEILYHGDFKKLFSGKAVTVLSLVCSLAVLAAFRMDLFGFDRYVPDASGTAGVTVLIPNLSPETRWNYYAEAEVSEGRGPDDRFLNFRQKEDAELLRVMGELSDPNLAGPLVREGIRTAESMRKEGFLGPNRRRFYRGGTGADGNARYQDVLVRWRLADGREVQRTYIIDLSGLREETGRLYEDPGFLKASYPVLKADAGSIEEIRYREWNETSVLELSSAEERQKLFETWREEYLRLGLSQREKESPVGALQFRTAELKSLADSLEKDRINTAPFDDYYTYPVYPSFTGTLELLRNAGVEAGEGL